VRRARPTSKGFSAPADMTDDERREWFIRHDNYFV
jgi:hypothetical protein